MCVVLWLFTILCLTSICADGATVQYNGTKTLNLKQREIEVPDNFLLMIQELKENRALLRSAPLPRQSQVNESSTSSSSSNRRCVCQMGVCKCCTGYVLDLINQKACMRITYHPGDFAFDVAMSLNDRVLYENSMSGKNPRPICIRPPRMPNLKVCSKFYNVFFPGRNFHFCLSMTGTWRAFELFHFTFDCLRLGANGLAIMKPQDNGGIPIPNPQGGVDAVIDSGEDDIEDYDENVIKSLFTDLFDE